MHTLPPLRKASARTAMPMEIMPAAAFHTSMELEPGESREMLVLLGIGDARTTGRDYSRVRLPGSG